MSKMRNGKDLKADFKELTATKASGSKKAALETTAQTTTSCKLTRSVPA